MIATLVDWSALGKGALAAVIGATCFVTAFSLVVLAGSRMAADRRSAGRARVADVALGAAAGVVCVAALVLGFWAMLHKG